MEKVTVILQSKDYECIQNRLESILGNLLRTIDSPLDSLSIILTGGSEVHHLGCDALGHCVPFFGIKAFLLILPRGFRCPDL